MFVNAISNYFLLFIMFHLADCRQHKEGTAKTETRIMHFCSFVNVLSNILSISFHCLWSSQPDAAGTFLPSGIYGSQTWPWTTSKPGEGE